MGNTARNQLPARVTDESRYADESGGKLQAELEQAYKRVWDEFGPLAYLYDMRTHGGLAHLLKRNKGSCGGGEARSP